MTETRRGVFHRCGSVPVEIEADKSDSYTTLLGRSLEKLHIKRKENSVSAFFKLNGVRILDEELSLGGRMKQWTLGHYLQAIKRPPSRLMLGVGWISQGPSQPHTINDLLVESKTEVIYII